MAAVCYLRPRSRFVDMGFLYSSCNWEWLDLGWLGVVKSPDILLECFMVVNKATGT